MPKKKMKEIRKIDSWRRWIWLHCWTDRLRDTVRCDVNAPPRVRSKKTTGFAAAAGVESVMLNMWTRDRIWLWRAAWFGNFRLLERVFWSWSNYFRASAWFLPRSVRERDSIKVVGKRKALLRMCVKFFNIICWTENRRKSVDHPVLSSGASNILKRLNIGVLAHVVHRRQWGMDSFQSQNLSQFPRTIFLRYFF